MNSPRTTREALMAELLGDVDGLLVRVETLSTVLVDAGKTVSTTVTALEDAGDKYRLAVTAFTKQAKTELAEYHDLKFHHASQLIAKTVEEQQTALEEAARSTFQSEAANKTPGVDVILSYAAKEFHRSMRSQLIAHGITALIAASFTASLVYLILK